MTGLTFDIEWEAGLSGKISPEMCATFAHLTIMINGQCVTNCVVGEGHKRRILVPLYSLAEWFCMNWWRIANESLCPGREIPEALFLERHGLLSSRNGFAIPDLRLYPEGDAIRLKWLRHQMKHQALEFFSDGEACLPRRQVLESLAGFIETVIERLFSRGIQNSLLTAEWKSIHALGSEETRFCETAARLGLDPFDLSDFESELVVRQLGGLPISLSEELANAATIENLSVASDWVHENIHRRDLARPVDLDWQAAKQAVSMNFGGQPWEEGYQLADRFLDYLGADGQTPTKLPDFDRLLIREPPPIETVDALVLVPSGGGPVCLTGKNRPDSRRFQFARSICEFFAMKSDDNSLLTTATTTSQKRSRAFAAELLAPRMALQARLKNRVISDDDVQDLAAEFQVSSEIIRRQIFNHQLASIL